MAREPQDQAYARPVRRLLVTVLLLALIEQLSNEECRLSLGKEVPVLQVNLPQAEVGS